ncbi:hypothetical protein LSH36_783g00006 [Paralvinella palmiformis]|uniref:Uricase n=1 Tax=Paralvinella palmiformis TaxID=53620 RepID=A0AAD9J0N7_9ANNE|nr:hypothetical protein LSH36_783g00006 [Paralvinella palmiformis]
MLPDTQVEFVDRGFGKNFVRLLHVKREGTWNRIKEIEVSTKLTLSSVKDFLHGDNSDIIATDSQKNTVYILAKKHGVSCIEEFGMILAAHFLKQYSHVTKADIYIEEKPWNRIQMDGMEHAHAFIENGDAIRFCHVLQNRNDPPTIKAGLRDMKIMKTTRSAFANFISDEYRSLPDMNDRIFCTMVYADWDYSDFSGLDFDGAWTKVKETILEVFAGPPSSGIFSPSVQKTLYDTQKLAMARIPQFSYEIKETLEKKKTHQKLIWLLVTLMMMIDVLRPLLCINGTSKAEDNKTVRWPSPFDYDLQTQRTLIRSKQHAAFGCQGSISRREAPSEMTVRLMRR